MESSEIYIEKLDSGYVATESGKRYAVLDDEALRRLVDLVFREVTGKLTNKKVDGGNTTVNSIRIKVEFEINPVKHVQG